MGENTTATSAAITASCIFGIGNLAYRYGDGNALAIAGQRCLTGTILLLPFVWHKLDLTEIRRTTRDRNALASIGMSGINLVLTAVVLRSLTGPQAGLAIATVPLFLLATHRLFVEHRKAPLLPLITCITASSIATLSGGLGDITAKRLALILIFLVVASSDVLLTERARNSTSSSLLVTASMIIGTLFGYAASLLLSPSTSVSTTGYIAAAAVGVCGTVGRLLRGWAIPFIGSVVVSTTSQIAAFVTAIGGVLLLSDHVNVFAAILSLIAAASSCIAMLRSEKSN